METRWLRSELVARTSERQRAVGLTALRTRRNCRTFPLPVSLLGEQVPEQRYSNRCRPQEDETEQDVIEVLAYELRFVTEHNQSSLSA